MVALSFNAPCDCRRLHVVLIIRWGFINHIQFCKCICTPNIVINFLDESVVKPPHSQPWMVAFVQDVSDVFAQRQVCTGTLIDGSKVLTAASCDVRYLSRRFNTNTIGKKFYSFDTNFSSCKLNKKSFK